MKKIQILLIEENRMLRDGILSMLKKEHGMIVTVAHRENIITTKHKEAIILLGVGERNQNSLGIVNLIKEHLPKIKVVLMNLISIQEDMLNFVQAGASGFILKDATGAEFIKTIRSVDGGARVLPPHLTGHLFSQIIEYAMTGFKPAVIVKPIQMSKREQEIIKLITDGFSNGEIAQSLHLSVYTVKSHVHNILNKLAFNTRVQISKYTHLSSSTKTAL